MPKIKAQEPDEIPVIRGRVVEAVALLWKDGRQIASVTIDPSYIPYQKNNLAAWFRSAYQVLGAQMRPMLGESLTSEKYQLLVNDGDGPKQGRGSNDNTFAYELTEHGVVRWRLVIQIHSEPHQKEHARKLQAGHIPKARQSWTKRTYWDVSAGKIFQYRDDMGEHIAWDPNEYFQEYPDHRGNIPVKQAS